jgi:glycosyltransferase involved in cell wall biosynthesis
MQRVFHVPSHLSYVSKLAGDTFAPVPSPSGAPLRVSDLLELETWDFFDILHLHTVELAASGDLIALAARLRETGKGFIFTLHDLVPNIEVDQAAFAEKTRLAARQASRVVTLTHAAAQQVSARFGITPSVIPHGYAVSPELMAQRSDGAPGLLVFGALRPNRDLLGLVRAWRQLPSTRLPLQVLLRSLGALDQRRYASELAQLAEAARVEPDLTVETIAGVLSPSELVDRCQEAAVLVMPYRSITHSGQLELSRDLGLTAVVPDTHTVRAQLSETAADKHPCVWFPTTALGNPIEFAGYLEKASETPNNQVESRRDFLQYRSREHENLLGQYGVEYNLSCEQR